MSLGTVVIAGRTYQVTGMRLHDAKLTITAHGWGPAPAVADQPAAVFGDDGRGVCQAWHVDIPALCESEDVHIVLPIQITHLEDTTEPCTTTWRTS